MPPDSTYILAQIDQPSSQELYYTDTLYRVSRQDHTPLQKDDGPKYIMPMWQMFLVALFIVYIIIIRPFLKDIRETRARNIRKMSLPDETSDTQYDIWLNRYNPYYASLDHEDKKRFLYRVKEFMRTKEFRFHAMVEERYIPVVISGTAIQLTFGLRNYLLDYFDVIHIMRREYVLNIDKETYYGHVSRSGIHISWSHFLEGYSNYTDSINLGLHEMAHALQYDSALGDEDSNDWDFKKRLQQFAAEGRPIFRAMRQGASHVLDDYAANNFDEFWVVSVETFFENPSDFKEKLPALYAEMVHLLNQDPLLPAKVVNTELV